MTTLVTGSGFIGSHIVKTLVEEGETPILYSRSPKIEYISDIVDIKKIKLIKGDILDFNQIQEVVKKEEVDKIIHTASALNLPFREESAYMGVKINIEGLLNILEIARINDLKKVVFSSSAVVYFSYQRTNEKTYNEDFSLMTLSGRPVSLYATTKIAGEFIGLNFYDLYGIDFVAVRYGAVYGPWRGQHAPQVHFFRDLIEKAVRGEEVSIEENNTWSGGIEFVYINDAVIGTLSAGNVKKPKTKIYNIGTGKTIEFKEVIDTFKRILPSAKISVKKISKGMFGLPYKGEDLPMSLANSRKELNYQPKYSLEQGMKDYIEWAKRIYKKQ